MQFQRSSPWQKDRKNPGLQGINSWPIGRLQLISHRRIPIGVLGHYWQLRMNSETGKAGGTLETRRLGKSGAALVHSAAASNSEDRSFMLLIGFQLREPA